MRPSRHVLVAIVALTACEKELVVEPKAGELQLANGHPAAVVVPPEGGVWYPTHPDGSPDYSASASVSGPWGYAFVDFGLVSTARIDAGFRYYGSAASIGIFPQGDEKR